MEKALVNFSFALMLKVRVPDIQTQKGTWYHKTFEKRGKIRKTKILMSTVWLLKCSKKIKYKCLCEMKCLVCTVIHLVLHHYNFFKFVFIFLWRWTNSNLNLLDLIHLDKNMKTKEMKNQTCWSFKISFQYIWKRAASITCVY